MSLNGTTNGIPNSVLAQTPIAPPPLGVVSNFVDPPNRGTAFIIIGGVLLPFVALFVGIRLVTKLRVLHQIAWDDTSCFASTICLVVYYINQVLGIQVGKFGRHGYDTSVLQIVNPWLGWTVFTENWLSTVTLGIAKLTFLLFYLTLFSPNRILRYMIYFGMVVTILVFLGFTLAQIILLVPHPGENWLEMYQDPREMAVLKISVPISVTSFIVDIYTFIIPIVGVSGLKLSRKRKIGVLMVFITGLCACIASSLSIYYKTRLTTIDSAWDSIPVIICALVEMCMGIICSCMPSLAKFTSYYFPNFSIVESVLSLKLFTRLTTHSKSNSRSFSIVNARKRLGSESDENLRKKASANGREREVEMGEDTLFEIEMGDLGRGQNQVKIISGNMNGRTDLK